MSEVRVSVNGVEVGSIPTFQYLELRSRTKRDWRVYRAQLGIVLKVIVNLTAYTIIGMPVSLVAMLVLCVMTPGMIANVVTTMAGYSPEQIEEFVGMVTSQSAVISACALILGCLSAKSVRRFVGFRNAFTAESDRLLRVELGVSASGPVHAYEYVDGNPNREL